MACPTPQAPRGSEAPLPPLDNRGRRSGVSAREIEGGGGGGGYSYVVVRVGGLTALHSGAGCARQWKVTGGGGCGWRPLLPEAPSGSVAHSRCLRRGEVGGAYAVIFYTVGGWWGDTGPGARAVFPLWRFARGPAPERFARTVQYIYI